MQPPEAVTHAVPTTPRWPHTRGKLIQLSQSELEGLAARCHIVGLFFTVALPSTGPVSGELVRQVLAELAKGSVHIFNASRDDFSQDRDQPGGSPLKAPFVLLRVASRLNSFRRRCLPDDSLGDAEAFTSDALVSTFAVKSMPELPPGFSVKTPSIVLGKHSLHYDVPQRCLTMSSLSAPRFHDLTFDLGHSDLAGLDSYQDDMLRGSRYDSRHLCGPLRLTAEVLHRLPVTCEAGCPSAPIVVSSSPSSVPSSLFDLGHLDDDFASSTAFGSPLFFGEPSTASSGPFTRTSSPHHAEQHVPNTLPEVLVNRYGAMTTRRVSTVPSQDPIVVSDDDEDDVSN